MTRVPPLTIGVPVYNGERYLAQALDSLLSQDYTDFTLVISDNCSADATPEIAASYASQDARVTVVRQRENIGGAANFSYLAHTAESPLFKWASADDLCGPSFVSRCVEQLQIHPEAVLAHTRALMISEDGEVLFPFTDHLAFLDPDPAIRIREFVRQYRFSNALQGVIRTDVLKRTALIAPAVSSDVTTLAQLALLGGFAEYQEPLFLRRRAASSVGLGTLNRREVQEWFRPGSRRPPMPVLWRVSWDIQKSIATAPMNMSDRLRCLAYYRQARLEELFEDGGRRTRQRMARRLSLVLGDLGRESDGE